MTLNWDSIYHDKRVSEHRLLGQKYSLYKRQEDREAWKKQLVKNQLTIAELNRLSPLFQQNSIEVTLLKGFALMGDVYQDIGVRFASDVDLLVHQEELGKIKSLMTREGYSLNRENKWLGNDFKLTMQKDLGPFEVTIEIHTRLFWHTNTRLTSLEPHPNLVGYKKFSIEDQLLHLCGHLAFQHSFLKLFWLLDIQVFLKKYEEQIEWAYFWDKARDNQLIHSCAHCLELAEFGYWVPYSTFSWKSRLSLFVLRQMTTDKFLIAPRSHPLAYLVVKQLCKDSSLLNMKYWWHWLRSKMISHT